MDFYLDNMLNKGVLTGSRAFNCNTNKSDYDIVITKSNLPKYTEADDYQCYDFNPEDSITEIPELEDEANSDGCLDYDQLTIWGPLVSIIKYWYLTNPEDKSTEVCINLFVYQDKQVTIYNKFKQLNAQMLFCHGAKLQDREYRIKAFTEIIKKVGITDA